MTEYKVIVDKSTVPVGTADQVRYTIAKELYDRKLDRPFGVVSNPEFLKVGAAIEDFMHPERIILGADDPQAIGLMRSVYAPFLAKHEALL